jgi:hypothetical protein
VQQNHRLRQQTLQQQHENEMVLQVRLALTGGGAGTAAAGIARGAGRPACLD